MGSLFAALLMPVLASSGMGIGLLLPPLDAAGFAVGAALLLIHLMSPRRVAGLVSFACGAVLVVGLHAFVLSTPGIGEAYWEWLMLHYLMVPTFASALLVASIVKEVARWLKT
jgi:hypothetical protein